MPRSTSKVNRKDIISQGCTAKPLKDHINTQGWSAYVTYTRLKAEKYCWNVIFSSNSGVPEKKKRIKSWSYIWLAVIHSQFSITTVHNLTSFSIHSSLFIRILSVLQLCNITFVTAWQKCRQVKTVKVILRHVTICEPRKCLILLFLIIILVQLLNLPLWISEFSLIPECNKKKTMLI